MTARKSRSTKPSRQRLATRATVERPATLYELKKCLDSARRSALPLRPRGAGTAPTDCNTCSTGVIIDMTKLDRILNVDPHNGTVTVEAGTRLRNLTLMLAKRGLELEGCYDQSGRTVGGAIAAPCFGPGIGNSATCFSSQVLSLKMAMADGRVMTVTRNQENLLHALRASYGLLGIICEATLRVRPLTKFSVNHSCVTIDKFCSVATALISTDIGLKFYLLPHGDKVYLDVRRYSVKTGRALSLPWQIKDWRENKLLPRVLKLLRGVVPFPAMRYRLTDAISDATHGFLKARLLGTGTNAMAASQWPRHGSSPKLFYSTWCFPAAEASVVIPAYVEFCKTTLAVSGYRCDMPAVGYRVQKNADSLLSPAFDESMIALQTMSTREAGWENFVIDLAEFAQQWGAIPIFSQSRSMRADYARQAYSGRIEFFGKMRRRLDPDGKFLNPYFAQYF